MPLPSPDTEKPAPHKTSAQITSDADIPPALAACPQSVIDRYRHETIGCYDWDGWRFILPDLPANAHLLCIDTRYGTTALALAQLGAQVSLAHHDAVTLGLIRERAAQHGCAIMESTCLDADEPLLPYADATLDGVVIHDINNKNSYRDNPRVPANFSFTSPAFLRELWRIVKNDGFVYLGVRNALGYDQLQTWTKCILTGKFGAATPQGFVPARLHRRLRRAGFGSVRLEPYTMLNGVVHEIIPASGYHSTHNSFARTERFKESLLGAIGRRLLAPAYGAVALKGPPRATLLDRLGEQLANTGYRVRPETEPSGFLRYLALPGKAIVSFGARRDAPDNVVTVIPFTPVIIESRRREMQEIAELRKNVPAISPLLPAIYAETSFCQRSCFVISEIAGTTVDRNVPQLESITERAAELLGRMTEQTLHWPKPADQVHDVELQYIFKAFANRYPSLAAGTEAFVDPLRAQLSKHACPAVRLHGDYKIENLILDPKTLEIRGVIDWEHSRPDSFPLIDILYLIVYNRIMVEKRDFLSIYLDTVLPGRFTVNEQRLVDTFCQQARLNAPLRDTLARLFFLHHAACRYRFNLGNIDSRSRIDRCLAEIQSFLASTLQKNQLHDTVEDQ